MDLPYGPVVKNPPANGFDPWSGKIPHAVGQLSPSVTTTEAHVLWDPRATTTEPAHHNH